MQKTIFKNWFVDFEPFNSIQPKNWRMCSLRDICDLKAGGDKPHIISDEKIDLCTYPIFNQIWSHEKEIEKLIKLRDTLLPKLMSGEIDVSKVNCD